MYRVPTGASRGLRWGCLVLAAVIGLLAVATDPADARSRRKHKKVNAYRPPYAALVLDVKANAVLHQSHADALRHPASLTKIMTLYLLFERLESGKLKLDTPLEVSAAASAQAPTKLGLKPGDTLEVEDAIKALVTKSANDASVVLAEAMAGSEAEFARMMTRKARELGMRRTVYRNASGLPDDEQVTTAREQALLGVAVQERFPRYYRYFSMQRFTFRGRVMRNHNRLLGKVPGVDGIKTGYTRASGFNLMTSVHRGGRHIVSVVLGGRSSRSRDAQMRQLIASHIGKASTRSVTRLAQVPLPKAEPAPAPPPRPMLASASSTPLSLTPSRIADATAAIPGPRPGSKTPIKPVPVKTLAVKMVPPKHAAPAPKRANGPEAKAAAIAAAKTDTAIDRASLPEKIAALPPAKAEEPPPAASKPRRGWAIQVGAFEDEKEAKQRLNSAQSKAPSLLENADAYTERTIKGDKTYFRARFAGFDRHQAVAACRRLKRNEIACLPLKI